MPTLNISDRRSVLAAVDECDRIGRAAFLESHGFRPAKSYFLQIGDRLYDSKAIVGVARGYEFPKLGPLKPSEFSGGEATVAAKLQDLGFQVSYFPPHDVPDPGLQGPALVPPLVLVENEATADERYARWQDVTGERYHFPNQYRNRIVPNRRFVYYRGSRRASGKRGVPEYFGYGILGEVSRDPDISLEEPKGRWNWIAEIAEYHPFSRPVPAKSKNGYLERIPRNLWQVPPWPS